MTSSDQQPVRRQCSSASAAPLSVSREHFLTTLKALGRILPVETMKSVSDVGSSLVREPGAQRIALSEMEELAACLLDATGDPLLLAKAYQGLNYDPSLLRKTYLAGAFFRRDALATLCRYFSVNSQAIRLSLAVEGELCILNIRSMANGDGAGMQREAMVYGIIRTLRSLGINEIQCVRFAQSPDSSTRLEYAQLFPVRVEFGGQVEVQIQIGPGLLDQPLGWHSCDLEQFARRERSLMRLDAIPVASESVMALLPLLCRQGAVDIDLCSHLLAVSRRTLQRNIQREGVSFRDLTELSRKQQAQRYLAQGYPLDRVAALLGYQQSAQFYRAFRQWFGCSPARFRSAQPGFLATTF